MRRVAVVMVLVGLVFTPAVWSGSLAGVTMSDTSKVGDTTLHLNGMGLRSKLWIKVYVAGLYVEQKSGSADSLVNASGTKLIVMNFLTSKANKKKMDGAWKEGFKANSPSNYKTLEPRVKKFMDLFGNLKDGDKVELTIVSGEGTHVAVNGKELGTIEGDDFGKALLLVWLGEEPPSDDLKSGLLGK